jgi:hypothetical protein
MSEVKRRQFLKRAISTMGGAAVGIGLPAAVVLPNTQRLAELCPVNTYLKTAASPAALQLPWSQGAEERLARVPAGFMREIARSQGARVAAERGESTVSLASVEAAIAHVTTWMNGVTENS